MNSYYFQKGSVQQDDGQYRYYLKDFTTHRVIAFISEENYLKYATR